MVISYKRHDTVKVAVDTTTVLNTASSDTVWSVGNFVTLTAEVPDGEVLKGWYKDGKKLTKVTSWSPWDGNYYEAPSEPSKIQYTITTDDALKGAIKFSTKAYAR